MGKRINEWTDRLLGPVAVLAGMVLVYFRFSIFVVGIVVLTFVLLTGVKIVAAPGPKAKPTVERLKDRLCKFRER